MYRPWTMEIRERVITLILLIVQALCSLLTNVNSVTAISEVSTRIWAFYVYKIYWNVFQALKEYPHWHSVSGCPRLLCVWKIKFFLFLPAPYISCKLLEVILRQLSIITLCFHLWLLAYRSWPRSLTKGLILGPVLFNIISDRLESTLSKFAWHQAEWCD